MSSARIAPTPSVRASSPAQGFTDDYVIDRGDDGRRFTKTEQVRMVGNSVSPPVAAALVRANVPEMVARDEAAA